MHSLVRGLQLMESAGERTIERALALSINRTRMRPEQYSRWLEKQELSKAEERRLARIALDWRIVQAAAQMPADTKILSVLTQVGTFMFDEALAHKLIHPQMTREEARALK